MHCMQVSGVLGQGLEFGGQGRTKEDAVLRCEGVCVGTRRGKQLGLLKGPRLKAAALFCGISAASTHVVGTPLLLPPNDDRASSEKRFSLRG